MALITAEDLLNKKTGNSKIELDVIGKTTLLGATGTAAIAGFYAYFYKQNMWKSMLIGFVAGGVVTRVLLMKKNSD